MRIPATPIRPVAHALPSAAQDAAQATNRHPSAQGSWRAEHHARRIGASPLPRPDAARRPRAARYSLYTRRAVPAKSASFSAREAPAAMRLKAFHSAA